MDRLELQKLRDLPIEGVAERLGLRITRGHKSLCPFHDDHNASLSYLVRKNTCKCFVCMSANESLGTIDLVMRYLNKDFKEACQWLANENNIILEEYKPVTTITKTITKTFDASRYEKYFVRPWLSKEASRFLFDERLLDPRVISWCRITSWRDRNGVNWLQIPYYDLDGKLIGIQNRNLDYCKDRPEQESKEETARFKFPYGSQTSIYNLQIVKRLKPSDECWIAEGCSDAWSHMSNHHKVIAIASATLLQPKDKQLLREITTKLSIRWKMMPDKDEPGLKLAAQLKLILPKLEIQEPPEGVKDYSEYYISNKKQLCQTQVL